LLSSLSCSSNAGICLLIKLLSISKLLYLCFYSVPCFHSGFFDSNTNRSLIDNEGSSDFLKFIGCNDTIDDVTLIVRLLLSRLAPCDRCISLL
jgi:hypothetical protein